jgi:hypothetical protein
MNEHLDRAASLETLLAYATPGKAVDAHAHGDTPPITLRYQEGGHAVEVTVSITITIDGRDVGLAAVPSSDGSWSAHALPFRSYRSLRELIADAVSLGAAGNRGGHHGGHP